MYIQSIIKAFENSNTKPVHTMEKISRLVKGIILLNPKALLSFAAYFVVSFILKSSADIDFMRNAFVIFSHLVERYTSIKITDTSISHLADFASMIFIMSIANFYKLAPVDFFVLSTYVSQTSYLYDNNFIEDLYSCITGASLFAYRLLVFISMSVIYLLRAICVLYVICFGDRKTNIPIKYKQTGVFIVEEITINKRLLAIKFIMLIIYSAFPISMATYFCYMILSKNSMSQLSNSLSQTSRNKIKGFKKYKSYVLIKDFQEITASALHYLKALAITLIACFVIRFIRNKVFGVIYDATGLAVNLKDTLLHILFSGLTFGIVLLPSGLRDVGKHIGSFNNLFVSFDIFSFVLDINCGSRPDFAQIDKLHLKIDKYYIATIPNNLIETIEDKYFSMKFTKLINNDYDQMMECIKSYENQKIKNYISNELAKEDNLLFDDIELELTRDYVKIKHDGYYYTFNIDKTMFIRLFGDSGSGKSTISEILGGYIIHNDSMVTGVSNGQEITTPISNMGDNSKLNLAEYKNTRDIFMIGNAIGGDNYKMACAEFQKIMKDTKYFEDLNIEKYKYMLDIPYKYWITSSGQESKLLFFKTLLETVREDSFLTLSDELLANIGDSDKEKIIKMFMDYVKGLDKKTTVIFTDHSNLIEQLGWYDLKISIENKKLVPNMKNKDGKYVKVDTFFTNDVNSTEINGIQVTREKIIVTTDEIKSKTDKIKANKVDTNKIKSKTDEIKASKIDTSAAAA